jgi:hypothetical protein
VVPFGRGAVGGFSALSRSLGLARTGTSSPILYEPSTATDTLLTLARIQLGANLRGKMGYGLQVSVRHFSFFFVRYLAGLLTCLLGCSAVAIVSSGLPRPVVLASHCDGRVACSVPWSRESFIPGP